MRRLGLVELLKTTGAFLVVSAGAVDSGLLLLDRSGGLDVPKSWYVNGPLGAWSVVGISASLALAGRLLRQVDNQAGRITGRLEGQPGPLIRSIPLGANGRQSTILASTTRSIFGEQTPASETYKPAVWRVPIPPTGNQVMVRESEIRAFLEVAYHRRKYQFSRPYWCRRRRPPLWRDRYEAYMRLLVESGLVEGRHTQGGASGRLVIFPREAVWYLKYESPFRVV